MRFTTFRAILLLYVLAAVVVTVHRLSLSPINAEYPRFNNFHIFRASFYHLWQGKELYIHYPAEHWDLYKYTPTFSLLMGPIAVLPFRVGALAWSLLNALMVFFSLSALRLPDARRTTVLLLFVLVELITNMQNSQSNGLMTGLMVFGFIFLENRKWLWAALFLVLSVYVKPFGAVALLLVVLYPQWRRFVLFSLMWTVVLGLLPLIVATPSYLYETYRSWFGLLLSDHHASLGINAMAWLETWFGIRIDKMAVVVGGAVILLLSFARWMRGSDAMHRMWLLASVLLWVVIFNHKAESPTFIIAMSGAGIWYFSQDRNPVNLVLILLAFVFTSLSPSDVFPQSVRQNLVHPYVLKAVPCILVWLKITLDLLRGRTIVAGNSETMRVTVV